MKRLTSLFAILVMSGMLVLSACEPIEDDEIEEMEQDMEEEMGDDMADPDAMDDSLEEEDEDW